MLLFSKQSLHGIGALHCIVNITVTVCFAFEHYSNADRRGGHSLYSVMHTTYYPQRRSFGLRLGEINLVLLQGGLEGACSVYAAHDECVRRVVCELTI